ncbi:molybdopterin-guanine dinucleotide biosynthesis protein B [Paenibacillus filicis]|uniref:Molybdopterin-guanine dinucleotide biosynthesis protein B n=1 Tax=Paenibacillus gyeongsangnamensis TaxID=3388067 RepID=A0ABT4QEP0_9BACL|nr:molybdopterin-guanine dinucleotide biosynthesis protein B [Paenibacillus filicis]MCZ8515257.1 molybdopterin-guanine dinucleotide biosynthesis protein B [Paenibacillus filicis]
MTSVLQIVGYKNSGKTTLVEHLIRGFAKAGYRVGTVKHDAHQFDVDHDGTDTWRHRHAGAWMTAITSDHRTAVMEERHTPLNEILQRMTDMDIVLVEEFKQEKHPKIVMVRTEEDDKLVRQLVNVAAVVSWIPELKHDVPVFSIGDADRLTEWILKGIGSTS